MSARKASLQEAGQFRDVLNESEISAYIVLGAKAFLSFLDYVGTEFTGMLSRPASCSEAFRADTLRTVTMRDKGEKVSGSDILYGVQRVEEGG